MSGDPARIYSGTAGGVPSGGKTFSAWRAVGINVTSQCIARVPWEADNAGAVQPVTACPRRPTLCQDIPKLRSAREAFVQRHDFNFHIDRLRDTTQCKRGEDCGTVDADVQQRGFRGSSSLWPGS